MGPKGGAKKPSMKDPHDGGGGYWPDTGNGYWPESGVGPFGGD